MPPAYYGSFSGDINDGTNSFKRWYWEHKITRSMYDNTTEPWTQTPWAEGPITNFIGEFNGSVSQVLYNMTAALGIIVLEMVRRK